MAAISQSFMVSSSTLSSSTSTRRAYTTRATIQIPKIGLSSTLPLIPKLTSNKSGLVEEREFARIMPKINDPSTRFRDSTTHDQSRVVSDPTVITKMHAIMEAIADRVEMHNNIGEQRNNWNSLLLTSINAITLSAATMTGIAAASGVVALKLSSTFMYLAAMGMLIIMNKIQPSQLAEEQRYASRLFKQLHCQIKTKLAIVVITDDDVDEAMEKVLALDRAYPLPLLGVMLEKFPSKVEPAVWWPKQVAMNRKPVEGQNGNGWNHELEEEMREIIKVLEVKDKEDYLRLGEKALKLNKALAVAGPLFTGLGALGSMFMGSSPNSLAVIVGVLAGGMASVLNTLEHGGQVGMVFEMYRSNAGFFKLMQESIESNLKERDVERRDNGELFEMKVALQLGRSLSELRDLAASSSTKGKDIKEFGSKLF